MARQDKSKGKGEGYLSAKESRAISRANRKITGEYEKKWRRKNVPESEYLTKMHDPANAVEFDDLHTYFYRPTAAYGHFGRTDVLFPWEKTDKAELLKKYL